jgi:hypothetical protein
MKPTHLQAANRVSPFIGVMMMMQREAKNGQCAVYQDTWFKHENLIPNQTKKSDYNSVLLAQYLLHGDRALINVVVAPS